MPTARRPGGSRWPTADATSGGDLAAAGEYLVVLIPPLPDPLTPDAPPQQRCVVIDPHAGAVVYSGPMSPH